MTNLAPIAVALFNATWQSAALVLALAIALRIFGRTSARTRCALWSALFFLCAFLPIVDLSLQHRVVVDRKTLPPARALVVADTGTFVPVTVHRSVSTPATALTNVAEASASMQVPPENTLLTVTRNLQNLSSALIALYVLGAAALLLRLAIEAFALLRVKRRCRPADRDDFWATRLPRRARLAASAHVSVPCVLGLGRPLIALPDDMLATLESNDLRRVVEHERAHLERYDDWWNLLERAALSLSFYNPAMYFAFRQISTEREIACDDCVVLRDGASARYAECLASLAGRVSVGPQLPAPGLYARSKQIVVRVERLLDRGYDRTRRFGLGIVLTTIAIVALAAAAIGLNLPVVADAQTVQPAPPAPPVPQLAATPKAALPPKPAPKASPAPRAAQRPTTAPVAPVHVNVPAIHVNVPAMHVEIPAMNVNVAPRVIDVPAIHVNVPAMHFVAPAAPTNLPALHVNVPPMHVNLPPMHVAMPAMPALTPRAYAAAVRAEMAAAPEMAAADPWRHGGSLVESLHAAGYGTVTVDDLVSLADVGVTGRSVDAYVKAFGHPSVEEMRRLANGGVTPSYIAALKSAGLSSLTASDAIRLADNGCNAPCVAAALRAKPGASVDDIIRYHNSGATP